MKTNKVILQPADCALDLGDGSERGFYVSQDYILRKLKKVHRGISLMYTYYPNDDKWPLRASVAYQGEKSGAWDYPYEDYFPYRGGREGLRNKEPFNFMKEIRQRGQDVVLTLTIDPELKEEDIILLAKDLRPYGRIMLRVNHECTGSWFCFNRRATYQELADFFVMVANTMHKYAPNVKMILCAGMFDESTQKVEMEDIFLEAHKVADIWSGDNYLSLHWGWPYDIATKETHNYTCYDVDKIYEKAKKTLYRLREITGQNKPMVLSELNADGDVTGAFIQSKMMEHFMNLLENDNEKWLSAFTFYQFRDDGRLGLEITDPNNKDVGFEQPILQMYKKKLHKPFFSQKIKSCEQIEFPVKLRWGSSEDSEGVETQVHFEKTPQYFELYFEDELLPMNMMIEFNGYWFYKAPNVKCIDLMEYFYDNEINQPCDAKLRFFCPPASGMNLPKNQNSYDCEDGDWLINSYTILPKLPKIRIEEEPVMIC